MHMLRLATPESSYGDPRPSWKDVPVATILGTGMNLITNRTRALRPGETVSVIIWVGSGLFSSGTTINIQVLNVNSVDVSFSVYLV